MGHLQLKRVYCDIQRREQKYLWVFSTLESIIMVLGANALQGRERKISSNSIIDVVYMYVLVKN